MGPAQSFATIFLLNYDITSYLLYFYFVSIFYFITYSPSAWAENKTRQNKHTPPPPQETQITKKDGVLKICFTDSTLQP